MTEPSDDDMRVFATDGASRRLHQRWFVDFATAVTLGECSWRCSVLDLSPGGACVRLLEPEGVVAGDVLGFVMPGLGTIPAEVLYDKAGELGLQFLHEGEGEAEMASYLVAIERNRGPEQDETGHDITLRASGGDQICQLIEISKFSANLRLGETRHLSPGRDVTLELPGVGRIAATVESVDEFQVGLAFLQPLDEVPEALAGNLGGDA